jgi:hydroxyacylglutathione hydrolase
MTSTLQIHQFTCRSDNFGVLVHDPETGQTATIDAPEESAIRAALKTTGWRLTHILNTHHHLDHTEGNAALKQEFGCTIIGPKDEADRIPGIDQAVAHGENFMFANHRVEVIGTPGHTLGQISLYFPDDGIAFTGDTLFALGCGRVFEGDMAMMWTSLSRLAELPPETVVYCGHEYTLANARFALTVDPGNAALQNRAKDIEQLRAANKPTLPTTIGEELATNPFLRPHDPAIRKLLDMHNATDAEVFAEIRTRKDKG